MVMIMLFVIMWRELVMMQAPTSLSRKVPKTVKKITILKIVVSKAPTSRVPSLREHSSTKQSLSRSCWMTPNSTTHGCMSR